MGKSAAKSVSLPLLLSPSPGPPRGKAIFVVFAATRGDRQPTKGKKKEEEEDGEGKRVRRGRFHRTPLPPPPRNLRQIKTPKVASAAHFREVGRPRRRERFSKFAPCRSAQREYLRSLGGYFDVLLMVLL
jgi:hypothetical protein